MKQVQTLGDALPLEIVRCKELLSNYRSIGQPGQLVASMLGDDIEKAEASVRNQDAVEMLICMTTLQGWTE